MITIKEIAKLANVSPGTVDRVLHKRGGVSSKTEDKIKSLLKEHNFKINVIASKLALRKKYNVSTLMPEYNEENLFWKSPYLGILKAEEEVSFYGVNINNFTFNQLEPNSYLKAFKALIETNPDAVIVVPTFKEETTQIVSELEKKKIPYFFLNIDIEGFNNISFIGQDSFKSGFLVGKLMHLCLGNKASFLTIQTRKNITNYHAIFKRIEGVKSYFEENNVEVENYNLSFENLQDMEKVTLEVNSFIKDNPTIKGIYVPSSQISTIANCIDGLDKEFCIIGHDTTPQNIECLKENKITFLISQKSFNQGYDAVQMISNYLVQKIIPETKNFSALEIITKENLNETSL